LRANPTFIAFVAIGLVAGSTVSPWILLATAGYVVVAFILTDEGGC
jgi:hypothetical protein